MYKNIEENKTTQFYLRLRLIKHKSRLIHPITWIKNLLIRSVYFLHTYNLAVSLIHFLLFFLEYRLVVSHCHSFHLSRRVSLEIVNTEKKTEFQRSIMPSNQISAFNWQIWKKTLDLFMFYFFHAKFPHFCQKRDSVSIIYLMVLVRY